MAGNPAAGNTIGGKTVTSVAPDGSSHDWTPAATIENKVTGANRNISDLAYSPDGSKIAYTVTGNELWVANADGTDERRLNISAFDPRAVAWSPTGDYIYFLTLDLGAPATVSVWRIHPNGTDEQRQFTVGDSNISNRISVSPAGDVALDTESSTHTSEIFVWNHVTRTVADTGLKGAYPDFSPDGTRLVFEDANQADAIAIANADGSSPAPIAGTTGDHPVWSPDGSSIAWAGPTGISVYSTAAKTTKPVAGAVGVVGLSWQPHAYQGHAAAPPTIDRIGGTDRIATAVDASRFEFAGAGTSGHTASVAVLSRDDTFADALSGSALAAVKNGPLLLTPGKALDGQVLGELHRVLSANATVYLLGGAGALSPAVEQAVRDAGFIPRRLQGSDRFTTSLAIDAEITTRPATVLVATGADYADALGAGAYAGSHTDAVVVLSNDTALTPEVRSYVAKAFADPAHPKIMAVGGQANKALYTTFPSHLGDYKNIQGTNRMYTAAMLAEEYGPAHHITALATGSGWADALAGGAIAAMNDAPLLLTGGAALSTPEVMWYQQPLAPTNGWSLVPAPSLLTSEFLVFGGPAVVSDQDVAAHLAVTGQTGWVRFTDRQTPSLP